MKDNFGIFEAKNLNLEYKDESKRAGKNNTKWDLPLDVRIIFSSNRCRDGCRTRIFFSRIHVYCGFYILSPDFKFARIRLEYFTIWPSEIFVGHIAIHRFSGSGAVAFSHHCYEAAKSIYKHCEKLDE